MREKAESLIRYRNKNRSLYFKTGRIGFRLANLFPPKTQVSIKGIAMSINTLPPTLPGCGIRNCVKNCIRDYISHLHIDIAEILCNYKLFVIHFIEK